MRPVLFLFIMPYDVFERNNKYCVYKVKPNGEKRGKPLGCHGTPDKAYAQITAIEANEDKEFMMPENNITTTIPVYTTEPEPAEDKSMHGDESMMAKMDYYVPMTVTSFADLDAHMEAEETAAEMVDTTNQFMMLAQNVMNNPDIEDKAAAMAALADEMGQRVSTVKEADGTKEADEKKEDEISLIDKVINAVGSAFGLTPKQEEKQSDDQTGMMLWKEADGSYRWIARYSNNFRDNDNPPEIISEASHRQFVERVDNKEVDLPELWLWHVKEWKWGKAEWVAYDDVGFAVAGGTVDKGFEPLAEMIMELNAKQIRVSHGMPKSSIKRDDNDPSVIVEHVTREISPLPAWAAANDLTGFSILSKETQMAIPEEKRESVKQQWNLSDEILNKLEEANGADAKEAREEKLESKEATDEPTKEPQPQTEEAQAEEQEPEAAPLTREELGDVVTAIGETLTALNTSVNALASEVKELKEAKAAEEELTLTDMFKRAAGHEQAHVDGRSSLAKSKPRETKPEQDNGIVATGNPFVDSMVNDLVTGTWAQGIRQEEARQ